MDERAIIFLGMTWLDIATITAILVGPMLAVLVTRLRDRWREQRERRTALYRTLMRTRQVRLSPEHVGALNLIDVEFYGIDRVLSPFRAYVKHLSSPLPVSDEQERYFEERHDLFVTVLQAMGRELGYAFDKHDLARLAYAPVGWERDESVHRHNLSLLNELLEGKRALPVTQMVHSQNNPFPPAPS